MRKVTLCFASVLWMMTALVGAMPTSAAGSNAAGTRSVPANEMIELEFKSAKIYGDPFNEVMLDVVFTDPAGKEFRVPAFWAGGLNWRARYASGRVGSHRYQTRCSDQKNSDLEGRRGDIEVVPYKGSNRLYHHGPLHVAADHRHLEHADGTPFLWLGDTWWMGLCKRLHFPDEFDTLTQDRLRKGFNVVQIIAGLYPDMPAFDPRGANEAGFPWTEDYRTIRPEYFDAADRRILHLVNAGITPCIVGAWGYHLPWMGTDRLKQHWRYLVARYGALPVVWCVAGEVTMPYYLSKTKEQDSELQRNRWTEIAAELHRMDPFHRLVTAHPPHTARNSMTDPTVLDFDMLQTGHGDRSSIPGTIRLVRGSRAAWPIMPVVNGEVTYEGILNTCYDCRAHLRCQWHLATQSPRTGVRQVAARWQLGHAALGRRDAIARLATGGIGEAISRTIPLVEFRAAPGMGRMEESCPSTQRIRRSLRGRNCG
jgi:hypothetical protein